MPEVKQYTMFNGQTTTADGKVDQFVYKSEAQVDKLKAEATKVETVVEVTKMATFALTQATSWDEFAELVPDPNVRLDMANYGLGLAQHSIKKDLMEDENSTAGVDSVYDLLADVQQPKEKRVSDPLASTRRAMRSLWAKLHPGEPEPTEAAINAVLAQFAGAAVETTT